MADYVGHRLRYELLRHAGHRVVRDDHVFFQELEKRRGRRERPDAQRVEEVRNEADAQHNRPFADSFTPNGGKPYEKIEGGKAAERDEEPGFDVKHGAYAMRVGRKCKPRANKRRPREA